MKFECECGKTFLDVMDLSVHIYFENNETNVKIIRDDGKIDKIK